jgi:hypothetical protein
MILLLFNTVVYVFLLLCLCIFIVCLCIFIVPAGNSSANLTEVFPCFLLSILNLCPFCSCSYHSVDCVWNVMAHAQKPDFAFQRNGRVHLYRRGRQFSRLLAAEMCASAVVMLDIPCTDVVWRVLATHSIRQFPLHFPSQASPCAITFQLDSTNGTKLWL